MRVFALFALVFFEITLTADDANGQLFFPIWRQTSCPTGQCPAPQTRPKTEATKTDDAPKSEEPDEPPVETLSVARTRFFAPSVEIADECDAILDRLEERYGKPKVWNAFPIYFERYRGDGIAGYTSYVAPNVAKVVCFEPFENAKGGTLDHELTHAFFFYFLNGNFDLFLNEGLAQNSEYRRRESLRQTVYRRYNNGEFWDISQLYGRNRYDSGLRLYHEGFSGVDFLVALGGSRWFAEFMTELVRTNDVDSALRRFYGYDSLDALQPAWRDYVEGGQDRQTVHAIQ